MNNYVLLIAFFALIYFMMIRPQQKQQKKRREMLENLRKGDKIVTIGGIEGTIKALRDERINLEVAKGVTISILKSAVGQVMEDEDQESETEEVTEDENSEN